MNEELSLMRRGTVLLQQPPRWIEVERGMIVKRSDGLVVGQVAAIVVNARYQETTHFLLTRLTSRPNYWLVPLDLIQEARAETLLMSVNCAAANQVPHQSDTGEAIAFS